MTVRRATNISSYRSPEVATLSARCHPFGAADTGLASSSSNDSMRDVILFLQPMLPLEWHFSAAHPSPSYPFFLSATNRPLGELELRRSDLEAFIDKQSPPVLRFVKDTYAP